MNPKNQQCSAEKSVLKSRKWLINGASDLATAELVQANCANRLKDYTLGG